MARRRPGDKPLFEAMMSCVGDVHMSLSLSELIRHLGPKLNEIQIKINKFSFSEGGKAYENNS